MMIIMFEQNSSVGQQSQVIFRESQLFSMIKAERVAAKAMPLSAIANWARYATKSRLDVVKAGNIVIRPSRCRLSRDIALPVSRFESRQTARAARRRRIEGE